MTQTYIHRLARLRLEIARQALDGFVVPVSDEHMSEYVGDYAQRLAWLTGFNGSAGSAVVLADRAAIFVDGRYTSQVRDQVAGALFDYCSVPKDTIGEWLVQNCAGESKIGYDPWLHTQKWVDAVQAQLESSNIVLHPVESNPLDAVWHDRPAPSSAPAVAHKEKFAGRSSSAKRQEIAEWLETQACEAVIISALDCVAWLLNLRGTDVPRTPVALSYVIVHADGSAQLFIAGEKVTAELAQHLGNSVKIRDLAEFPVALSQLSGKRVSIDPDYGAIAIVQLLEQGGAAVTFNRDPTMLPKAIKNSVEQQGQREAHARDGASVTRFLCWLDRVAPNGNLDEVQAADRLEQIRRDDAELQDLSFHTISAAGPHAALPHYRADEANAGTLQPSSIYLVDSGGQYPTGTTDITRTVWIGPGEPSPEIRDRNTRVLKGHIAIAKAIFPQGTTGGQIDSFARQYLWHAGLDFAHGTGHGVGSFLAVHEGPQRIAKPSAGQSGTNQELFAGMILSNEPGYYKPGHFGIRIENLVLVEQQRIDCAEGEYLGFETLTHVPFDRRLIDLAMLTPEEIEWIDAYHAETKAILASQMDGDDLAWLEEQCAPLNSSQ